MKIGVNGASGKLGSAIVDILNVNEGIDVVSISRTPKNGGVINEQRYGNYDEPHSLPEAYAGLEKLVLIPSADPTPGKRARQNISAIDAAVAAGVRHILFISATGVKNVDEPDISASFFKTEQHLMRSATEWTILRMSAFAETFMQQIKPFLGAGALPAISENRVSFVSRLDVARAAAAVLMNEGHNGALYYATGPEALSGAERAKVIADVSGQPFVFAPLGLEGYQTTLLKNGVNESTANFLTFMQAQQSRGIFNIVTGDVENLTGIESLSLEAVAQSMFAKD